MYVCVIFLLCSPPSTSHRTYRREKRLRNDVTISGTALVFPPFLTILLLGSPLFFKLVPLNLSTPPVYLLPTIRPNHSPFSLGSSSPLASPHSFLFPPPPPSFSSMFNYYNHYPLPPPPPPPPSVLLVSS